MKDFFGKDRGRCNGCNDCVEYQLNPKAGNACDYCGCKPTQHQINLEGEAVATAPTPAPVVAVNGTADKEREERERKEKEERDRLEAARLAKENEEKERERKEKEEKERREKERKEKEDKERKEREDRVNRATRKTDDDSEGIGGIMSCLANLNHQPKGDLRARRAPTTPMPALPPEILKRLFSNLSAHDLCQVSRVCKTWRITANDPALWSEICKRLWSNRRLFSRLADKDGATVRWKLLYLKWRKEVMASIQATPADSAKVYGEYQAYCAKKKWKLPEQGEMICYKQSWFPVQLYMINPSCKKKDVSALIVECNNHFWIRSSKLRQLTNSEFEAVSFVVKELPKERKAVASVMELKTMIGFELGKLLQEQVLLAPTVLQSIIVFMYAIACGKNRWPEVLSSADQLPVKKNNFSSWKMHDKFFHKRLKPFDCILDFTQTIIRGMNLFLLISYSTPKHILHEVHEIKFKYDTTKPASESTEVWSAVLATVKESV